MIIFDLDGTLADCEHRLHFVDPEKNPNYKLRAWPNQKECESDQYIEKEYINVDALHNDIFTGNYVKFNPDWKSFFEVCDKDTAIQQVIELWNQQISLGMMGVHQIWSGRCESVRKKTEQWLDKHLLCFDPKNLKMRPIGDNTPDDQLKERWLDELIISQPIGYDYMNHPVDFVFDDSEMCCNMWHRRGIFVFDCNQSGK